MWLGGGQVTKVKLSVIWAHMLDYCKPGHIHKLFKCIHMCAHENVGKLYLGSLWTIMWPGFATYSTMIMSTETLSHGWYGTKLLMPFFKRQVDILISKIQVHFHV